jgi:hypothetical protein
VVNIFDAENQEILPEIPDALRKERNVPSVTRKVILLVVCKTKSKDHGKPRVLTMKKMNMPLLLNEQWTRGK